MDNVIRKLDCEHPKYSIDTNLNGEKICGDCYPPALTIDQIISREPPLERDLRPAPVPTISRAPLSNPSDRQVGGDHYRRFKIQPIEYVLANGMGYLPGCALKYLTRYKEKGGAQDIKKCIHYLELILEFEYGESRSPNGEKKE